MTCTPAALLPGIMLVPLLAYAQQTTRDRWIDRCAQWLDSQGWTSGQREIE